MKFLVAGDFHSEIHEPSFCSALRESGHEIVEFGWHAYFKDYQLYRSKKVKNNTFASIVCRFQNKYSVGPLISRINRDFLECCEKNDPDLIFIFRGIHIRPKTLEKVKKRLQKTRLFAYNNDDPFGKTHHRYFWRNFLRCLPFYDHIFAYREKNIADYAKIGITRASILRSYYIKERNYHMASIPTQEYVADVGFIGHFENDGRDEYCRALAEIGRIKFRINGAYWHKSRYHEFLQKHAGPILPLYRDNEYNIAVNSVKIALVFFSSLNNDTYTRRTFEIPAARVFMLSQFSEEAASLFTPGKEAEYFQSKEEMIRKIDYYLTHDTEREAIARNGFERLLRDGHEVRDRAAAVLSVFNEIKTGDCIE